jgi:hypothetical protein
MKPQELHRQQRGSRLQNVCSGPTGHFYVEPWRPIKGFADVSELDLGDDELFVSAPEEVDLPKRHRDEGRADANQ